MSAIANKRETALRIIQEQLNEAVRATKCHKCGCLHKTVEALAKTQEGQSELASVLSQARTVFVPKEYDCLGCPVCYPAIAANAFVDANPEQGASLDLCPTEEPELRSGWPPFPGDYHVLRFRAPVAVCTLNSADLAARLRDLRPVGLAITGTMHTENLGIERLIRNTLANPNLRFLVLCGQDTQQRVGHLPGQALVSLFSNGADERKHIRGAAGKRPVLKNLTAEEITAFREQVELLDRIGEERTEVIGRDVAACNERNPGPVPNAVHAATVETLKAAEPERLVIDPSGYFVLYPEARRDSLVVEHYTNSGVLDCVLEGHSSAALYSSAIGRGLVSRLDHAAYLGCELARAERSLQTGEPYVQDRAPGDIPTPAMSGMAAPPSCGCSGEACK